MIQNREKFQTKVFGIDISNGNVASFLQRLIAPRFECLFSFAKKNEQFMSGSLLRGSVSTIIKIIVEVFQICGDLHYSKLVCMFTKQP
jgi:hypothetical protein